MHRFFVPPDNIIGRQLILTGEQAHQVAQVLRMRPGDEVVALDNAGWEYGVRLTAVSRQQVTGDILQKRTAVGEPSVHMTLYMALLKREKFEWVLQKGTEVGVNCFVPVVTRRTLVQNADIKAGKLARWHKIIAEAAEQSGRGRVPALHAPVKLADAFRQLQADVAIIPWEAETAVNLRAVVAGKAAQTIALFIGPEGGFAPEEIEMARQHGAFAVTLGKRILRAETAAIAAAVLLEYEHGEMGNDA